MSKWLNRARAEILKTPGQAATVTIDRNLTNITIVPHPARFPKNDCAATSNDCNDSSPTMGFSENGPAKPWSENGEALPCPGNVDSERLKQVSLAFRSGPFAEQANALGWNEISLFGVHGGTHPKERLDAWGLIPMLAWTGLGLTLTKVEVDAATLTSPRGSLLRHPRKRASHDRAIPWQAHASFSAGGVA